MVKRQPLITDWLKRKPAAKAEEAKHRCWECGSSFPTAQALGGHAHHKKHNPNAGRSRNIQDMIASAGSMQPMANPACGTPEAAVDLTELEPILVASQPDGPVNGGGADMLAPGGSQAEVVPVSVGQADTVSGGEGGGAATREENRRGAKKRQRYSQSEVADISARIDKLCATMPVMDAARLCGVSPSMVIRWQKAQQKTSGGPAKKQRTTAGKTRLTDSERNAWDKRTIQALKEHVERGLPVSLSTIARKMKKTTPGRLQGETLRRAREQWRVRACRLAGRMGWTRKRCTKKHTTPKERHDTLRVNLLAARDMLFKKHNLGIQQRYNIDETAICLEDLPGMRYSYAPKGQSVAKVNVGRASKRVCSFVAFSRADGRSSPRGCLIFFGKGKVTAAEKEVYMDGPLDVLWQKKAWMDGPTMYRYAKTTLEPHMDAHHPAGEEVVVILDNLSGHRVPADIAPTHDKAFSKRIKYWFLRPNSTHIVQPLDRGIIKAFKDAFYNEFEHWAEQDGGIESLSSRSVDAKKLRMMVYGWCAKSWARIQSNEVLQKNCWRECGMDMCENNDWRSNFHDAESGFRMPPSHVGLPSEEEEEMRMLQKMGADSSEVILIEDSDGGGSGADSDSSLDIELVSCSDGPESEIE